MTTINNPDDFLKALDENPQWLAAVRDRILGQELLNLPARFEAFVQRMDAFIEQQVILNKNLLARMDRIEADMAQLKTDVAVIKTDITGMKTDITGMKTDITGMKTDITGMRTDLNAQTGRIDNALGSNYENKIIRQLPAIAGQHLSIRNVKVINDQLPDMIYDAQEKGLITSEQGYELLYTDLVFSGNPRSGGPTRYILAEISITASDSDVTRASQRAAILADALQTSVTPAVICETADEERKAISASHNVTIIQHPAF